MVRKWLNVGIAEKSGVNVGLCGAGTESSFAVHSLFKVLATVVHSYVDRLQGLKPPVSSNSVVAALAATHKSKRTRSWLHLEWVRFDNHSEAANIPYGGMLR